MFLTEGKLFGRKAFFSFASTFKYFLSKKVMAWLRSIKIIILLVKSALVETKWLQELSIPVVIVLNKGYFLQFIIKYYKYITIY